MSNRTAVFIADPLYQLKRESDSSLALAQSAERSGMKVYWTHPKDLEFKSGEVWASLSDLQEKSFLNANLETFDLVFIRKDPPFDTDYIQLCWLTSLLKKPLIVNRPEVLLNFHEKLIPFFALKEGVLQPDEVIDTYLGKKYQGTFPRIAKPFLGHGGEGVRRVESQNELIEGDLIQPILEEVKLTGDRRVLFWNGELLGHFSRIPPQESYISNLAQGGTAKLTALTPKEENIIQRLGRFLMQKQILFAGADFIADKVSEVNITSPTGLRTLEKMAGINLADRIIQSCIKML